MWILNLKVKSPLAYGGLHMPAENTQRLLRTPDGPPEHNIVAQLLSLDIASIS